MGSTNTKLHYVKSRHGRGFMVQNPDLFKYYQDQYASVVYPFTNELEKRRGQERKDYAKLHLIRKEEERKAKENRNDGPEVKENDGPVGYNDRTYYWSHEDSKTKLNGPEVKEEDLMEKEI